MDLGEVYLLILLLYIDIYSANRLIWNGANSFLEKNDVIAIILTKSSNYSMSQKEASFSRTNVAQNYINIYIWNCSWHECLANCGAFIMAGLICIQKGRCADDTDDLR